MKYTSILLIALIGFLSSCSSDEPETFIDFTGTYLLEVKCYGPLGEDNGATYTATITKTNEEGIHAIDFGDEVIFQAEQVENTLVIAAQTINEGLGFDEVFLEGEMRFVDNAYVLDVVHNVDDEGISNCNFRVVKTCAHMSNTRCDVFLLALANTCSLLCHLLMSLNKSY